MNLTIGITGGIGSGKSIVCRIFQILGAPVFEADLVSKHLINTHSEIKKGLINLYGELIYTPEGIIDRKKLAGIIFTDDLQRKKVNHLIHPFVFEEFCSWKTKQKSAYVIHEAAILFESGLYKNMDFNILVSAPENQRIERVISRDNLTAVQVRERMSKQWSDDKKRELASFEIVNDNKNLIIPLIIKIDKNLREHGKIW